MQYIPKISIRQAPLVNTAGADFSGTKIMNEILQTFMI